MPQRNLDIIVSAKDEASGTFHRVGNEMRSLRESAGSGGGLFSSARDLAIEGHKSGESYFERLLKGGGALGLATFAIEGLGKAAKTLDEDFESLDNGTKTLSQVTGDMVSTLTESIPVLGTWVEALGNVGKSTNDGMASFARSHEHFLEVVRGIDGKITSLFTGRPDTRSDEDYIEQELEDPETVKARKEKAGELQEKTTEELIQRNKAAALAGKVGRQKDLAEEELRYDEQREKIVQEQRAALKSLGKRDFDASGLPDTFKKMQDAVDLEHKNRERQITGKPISVHLAAANDERGLTGQKEIAEERFALLAAKSDPTKDAVERGNKIAEKGFKDVADAVGGKKAAERPDVKNANDYLKKVVGPSLDYSPTGGSLDYYVDSHGRHQHYTADHPNRFGPTNPKIEALENYGRYKELEARQRLDQIPAIPSAGQAALQLKESQQNAKAIAHLASIDASLQALVGKQQKKSQSVFGY